MSKQITLVAWARTRFDPPPSQYTLRKWARNGWVSPKPVKIGRTYYVHPQARHRGEST